MEIQTAPAPILPARTALLFFSGLLLLYLIAGLFLQNALGLLGIFLNQILFLFLPTVWLSHAWGISLDEWPAWKRPGLRKLLLVAALTVALSFAIDQLVSFQERFWPSSPDLDRFYNQLVAIQSKTEGLLKLLILAVTPAFAEEIFFRGLLQPSWTARFGKKLGVVFTSLAFALAHGNPQHFHFYFLLGLFLGGIYEWQGSLWLPILAHFVNNSCALFLSG
jgi:CAAX protease family protein